MRLWCRFFDKVFFQKHATVCLIHIICIYDIYVLRSARQTCVMRFRFTMIINEILLITQSLTMISDHKFWQIQIYHNFTNDHTLHICTGSRSFLISKAGSDSKQQHCTEVRKCTILFWYHNFLQRGLELITFHIVWDTIRNSIGSQNGSSAHLTVSLPWWPGQGQPRWCSYSRWAPSASWPSVWWPPPPAGGSLSQSSDCTWQDRYI